jgi:hypothetical protein
LLPERYFYMTYNSTVSTDAPRMWYHADDTQDWTITGKPVTNSGSQGGTATTTKSTSGTMVQSTSTPSGIPGHSFQFNNNQYYISQASGAFTSTRTLSIEVWYRHDTNYGATPPSTVVAAQWVGQSSGNSNFDIRVGTTAGQALVFMGTSSVINITTAGNITDGNWHHLAATFDSTDNKFRLYVDGVLKATSATQTTIASTSGTFYWGAVGGAGYGWLDEPAFYTTTLSATQVANHYAAGTAVPSADINVTPPAMTMSETAPAPTQYVGYDGVLNVPPMALSLASVVPASVTGSVVETLSATATRAAGGGGFTYLIKFPSIDASKAPNDADLTFTYSQGSGSGSQEIRIYRATQDWAEGASTTVTYDTSEYASYLNTATFAGNFTVTVDVTSIAQKWSQNYPNYGFVLVAQSGSITISSRTSTTTAYRPTLLVSEIPKPPAPVTVVAPAMTASLATSAPAITATASVTNAVPVAALDLTAIDAGVATTTVINTSATAPVMTAGMEFTGGTSFNPDYFTTVPAMIVALTTPNAAQRIEYNVLVQAPATYFGNLESEPATVSLTTNRIAFPPAMTMNMKWPGIYVEQGDRYLTLLNNIPGDFVWYKMGGEVSTAGRLTDAKSITRFDGYVFGNPDFNIPDGPELRKAAHFDGVDDYMVAGPYSKNGIYDNEQAIKGGDHSVTIEFSIRTTQLNGTVFNATGGGNGAFAAISPTYFAIPSIQRKLNLKNGYLHVIDDMMGTKTLTRSGFISDGEWHHIVMSMPVSTGVSPTHIDDMVPSYLMVDGKVVLSRYGLTGGESWIPYAFMADADFNATLNNVPIRGKNVTGYLAGDLRDVIIRPNTYVDQAKSIATYYEWSDSVVSKVDPITVSLTSVNPIKARGDAKRMLALFGLPIGYNGATGQFTGGEPISAYMSKFSGFVVNSFEDEGSRKLNYSTADADGWERIGPFNMGSWAYRIPAVFYVGNIAVYPVSITGMLPSVDGVRNPDAEMITGSNTNAGQFVDYETGMPRFINLQEDLAEPITNYDIVTVTNYPWVAPNGYDVPMTGSNNPSTNPELAPEFGLFQHDLGMSRAEWNVARDNLRDSLLQAAYDGVNLWIGEYHMAQHLGFIGDVDFHSAGQEHISRLSFDYDNYAAAKIDAAHFVGGRTDNELTAQHGYYLWPHRNTYRRIVAEIPDLTDLPTTEFGERIEGWSANDFEPNGSFLCHDIVKRPNGLQVGDKVWMDILFKLGSAFYGQTEGQGMTQYAPQKRYNIVSARPDGIVGRVVSREVESYFDLGKDSQGNPVVIDNPYKNNAYTIAAERGSVVRGRPIRGRAFIELMELGASTYGIAEDKNKNKWHGNSVSPPVTTWAFDTRRLKEVKLQNVTVGLILQADDATGSNDGSGIKQVTTITYYMTYEAGEYVSHTSMTMHMRGLNWLASAPDTNGDDFIGYAAPITVNLTTPAPVHSNSKNPVSEVRGAMRLDMEVRQPFNYNDGSVVERTLPMELSLDMRGIGKTTQVPPMVVSLSTVAPVIDAETETITLYMDNTDALTLFIKEEN